MPLYPNLQTYVERLIREKDLIAPDRRPVLESLSKYVVSRRKKQAPVWLNFICTHNSRRSQMCQVMGTLAARWYGLERLACFSGGTEATACNPRTIDAFRRAGFEVQDPGGDNPRYRVSFATGTDPLICFSKTWDHPDNPREGFAAVMTCDEASEACPFIPGADGRISLTYQDPKTSDGTPAEKARYDERLLQIGRELFFALGRV